MMLDSATRKMIRTAQRNEITEHLVYEKLAQSLKDPHNAEIEFGRNRLART